MLQAAPLADASRSSVSPRSGATRSCRSRKRWRSTRCSRSSPSGSGSRRSCCCRSPGARCVILPRTASPAGAGAGALLATAYGLQTAGLDLTTVSSTGFITGLYVVLTPLDRARRSSARRSPPLPGLGVALAVAGLLLLNGVPGGSAARKRARARERRRPVVPDRRDGAVCAAVRRARADVPADGGLVPRRSR